MHSLLSKYLFYYPATLLKGESVGRHLKNYEQFQYFTKEQINQYQLSHLNKILHHAYSKSSYYREVFDKHGVVVDDIRSLEDMKKLPFLSKDDVVTRFGDIVSSDKQFLVSKKTTGGSTGEAVTILKNADALARERAATWRSYKWAGVSIGDAQARFWGTPLVVGQRLKYKIIDLIANRKRFSAFEINEERLKLFFEQLEKFKPAYLYGYVSIIEIFSKYISDNNLKLPSTIKSVITTSEVLSKSTRVYIEGALNLKVYNEYGCGEVGSIAHECGDGSMHVMDDNLILEIIHDSKNSESGEIVVTDLFNYAMPIIRYKLGDYASISNESCTCGRTLKTIGNVHGRAYDCIITEDEKLYHPEIVMYIFEAIKDSIGGIKQFQVVQEKSNLLCVKIVIDNNVNSEYIEKYIEKEFKSKLHPKILTRFEYVETIPREKSGKLRLIKSMLTR